MADTDQPAVITGTVQSVDVDVQQPPPVVFLPKGGSSRTATPTEPPKVTMTFVVDVDVKCLENMADLDNLKKRLHVGSNIDIII